MQTLDESQFKQVHGGNFIVPVVAAAGIGACTNLLAWAIQSSAQGNTEDFSYLPNYLVEASVGALIGTFSAIGFVFATS